LAFPGDASIDRVGVACFHVGKNVTPMFAYGDDGEGRRFQAFALSLINLP
jgi:hypothetical protein